MNENCVLCGSETTKKVRIAHSPRPICQHCVNNIIEGENKKPKINCGYPIANEKDLNF